MTELSIDARCLISGFFSMGPRTTIRVGGRGSLSVLTKRAQAAMSELVEAGYVEASEYNVFGRMQYVGTDKCHGAGLSYKDLDRHGRWQFTEPNPVVER